MILCDASRPDVSQGVYVTPYNEAVDGYRHGYYDQRKRRVRWTRNPTHPPDRRCPECSLRAALSGGDGA